MYSLDYFESRQWDLKDQYGGWGDGKKLTDEQHQEIANQRKNLYMQFLEEIKEKESSEEMIAEIDGEMRSFSVKVPKMEWDGTFDKTFSIDWMSVLSNKKVEYEYVESVEYGSLYREKGSEGPYMKRNELKLILLRKEAEEEKQRIIKSCEMKKVHLGRDEFEVATFVAINHPSPSFNGERWALIDGMCYPLQSKKVGYAQFEYILDESRNAISLDELYSF